MTEIKDTGKRCSDCTFWISADRKTGICSILIEDDHTPFESPASGYCTEHKNGANTLMADAVRRCAVQLAKDNARLYKIETVAKKVIEAAWTNHENREPPLKFTALWGALAELSVALKAGAE